MKGVIKFGCFNQSVLNVAIENQHMMKGLGT